MVGRNAFRLEAIFGYERRPGLKTDGQGREGPETPAHSRPVSSNSLLLYLSAEVTVGRYAVQAPISRQNLILDPSPCSQ